MAFDLSTFITSLASLLIGSGLAAAYFKQRDKELADLKGKVERHCDADRSQEFATRLEIVVSQNNQILEKVTAVSLASASQVSIVARLEKSLADLWEKFDDFRQNHPGGKR